MKTGLLGLVALLVGSAQAVSPREGALSTIRQSIQLYKETATRKKADEHYVESVRPAMDLSVGLLSRGADVQLMKEVLSLASAVPTADEELMNDLGKIYQTNGALFETEYKKLKTVEQTVVWNRLELGWENLMHEKDRSPKEVKLTERLQQLRPVR